YFSHPDWYDADFRPYGSHPVLTKESVDNPRDYGVDLLGVFLGRKHVVMESPSESERKRMLARHRTQITELLENYGKIDMMCLDIQLGPDTWDHVKETIKMARKIQPDVMFRARGIGNYGDYYTPEGYIPNDSNNTGMPWMVIYPLGESFSYEKDGRKYKGTKWVIHSLIDTCAKGGNFMVGIGPNGDGKFHDEAIYQLEEAGAWLEIHGEGIFKTRIWHHWNEGDDRRFTRSKDGTSIYMFILSCPSTDSIKSRALLTEKIADITALGMENQEINWVIKSDVVEIFIPKEFKEGFNHAGCFKINIERP
ncbi:MAG: alpha-L-fucosidase, partial [Promethearchaeota archaeon]